MQRLKSLRRKLCRHLQWRDRIGEIDFPEGVIVGGILKDEEMLKPDSSSKIEEGDVIALFALSKDIPEVERLLQVTIDYFNLKIL